MTVIDKVKSISISIVAVACMMCAQTASAADRAPDWMQALKSLPVPAHDDKADAATMYSEEILTVKASGKMTTLVRKAYKILRPDSPHALVSIPFDDQTRILDLHAWSIPLQGKDYAVKEKDAAIVGYRDGSILVTDAQRKQLLIPAAGAGALVGFEYEQEDRPYFQEDNWIFQDTIPVREARYTLQLPVGWTYKPLWRNRPAQEPVTIGERRWQWVVTDIKAIKYEDQMPPLNSLSQQLLIQLVPAAGEGKVAQSWHDIGNWYVGLTNGRRDSTPAIKQKVTELTTSQTTLLGKMQAVARFAQSDIRYVAILLGIGGVQPHYAADVFTNRYGDCKDKATLMSSMLKEIGVDSYYVIINNEHDVVPVDALPSTTLFNHAIVAIKLPDTIKDASLIAVTKHPVLGSVLFFDPTNEFIPFGQLPGYLQGNNAMLVRADGTELITLPKQATSLNGLVRTAKLKLDDHGKLSGDVTERYVGHISFELRSSLQQVLAESERTRFLEKKLGSAFSAFTVGKFEIHNQADITQPLEFRYSFEAEKYAKATGDLLMVRPRILGEKSGAIMETAEKRENAVQFVSLQKDTDDFVIALPDGYSVDDVPAAVDIDYPFGDYHSKVEVAGKTLRYTRTFEIKEFTVPVDKLDDLKKFYRRIYADERAIAVLVNSSH